MIRKKLLAILLVFFLIITGVVLARGEIANDFLTNIRLITQAYQVIRNEYIEEVDSSRLIEAAIKGMLNSLDDPNSRWLSPEDYQQINVERKGEFGGVGMKVGIRDNRITIIAPLEGTPASKAGLQPGDIIIRIDGESTEDMGLDEAVSKIRGEVGTKVRITVQREGSSEPLEFTITRSLIQLPNLKKKILEERIGYIRILGFTDESTAEDLQDALVSIQEENIDCLILDLRNNPGGLLSQAIEVTDEFLSSGVIVSTKGRDPSQNQIYSAQPGGKCLRTPLVVLINKGSASASEIVAGAIKDHKRGIVAGTPSFGKGTVQSVIPLENGGAIALTTAKYYTPAGVSIEGKGIEPNFRIEPFIPTAEEKEKIEKLADSTLLEEFLQENPEWEQLDLDPLLKKLGEEGIKVDEDLLRRVLRQIDGIEENDILNDRQLLQTIELIKSFQILEGRTSTGERATQQATQ